MRFVGRQKLAKGLLRIQSRGHKTFGFDPLTGRQLHADRTTFAYQNRSQFAACANLAAMFANVAGQRIGQLLDLAQQIVGAGVGRVRRPIAADAAVVMAVPFLDQLGVLLEARMADRRRIAVLAVGQRARLPRTPPPADTPSAPMLRSGCG